MKEGGARTRSLIGHTVRRDEADRTGAALAVPQKPPYLLVGVRPVKAQEQVGGPAMQKEIRGPERDGEALDGVAEVERDPEVLGIRVRKDVLQERSWAQSRTRRRCGSPRSA